MQCYPPGVPRILMIPFPMQIVQIPGQLMMVFEYDHFVRFIDLERRQHPKDLNPTWMGDSIGHWEGDTLVVDTVGLNDKNLARPSGPSPFRRAPPRRAHPPRRPRYAGGRYHLR